MNIIIVAGGLGTRFQDLSVFPKILLPTKKYNSLLEQNYDVFINGYDNKLFLIINEKYYNMVNNYCHVNNIDMTIIKSSNTNGSYNTILSIYDQIPHDNVLFVWSDLELEHNDLPILLEDTIITYPGKYRYIIQNGHIMGCPNYTGNIPGIYYIKDLNKYFTKYKLDEHLNFDIVDMFQEFSNFNSQEYKGIINEYRDKDIYVNHIKSLGDEVKNSFKTRFFNMIQPDYSEPNEPKIKKWAINKDYYHLIQKEYDWYNKLKQQKLGNNYTYDMIVPKVYDGMIKDNTGFVMTLLDGYQPLHTYIKKHSSEDVQTIYKTIHLHLDALSNCKKEVDDIDFFQDLEKEIITKVIDRCEKIKYMLINYETEHLQVLLNKAYDYLCDNIQIVNHKVLYCVCHGDLNGSNILVNPKTKDVKFLDPRGYFGYTTFYGWQDYEYAKLLYCLDGYDDFNNLPQIYGIDKPIRLKWFDQINYLNKKKYRVLVGVIWVALAGYISQDIMKANIAYEYGIQMLQEVLKENE